MIALAIATTPVLPLPASGVAAPDPAAVVRLLRDQDAALLRVGERLVVDGRPFCGESGRSAGMIIQLLSQYGRDYRAAAASTLGIADRPTVTIVAAGGAAETAGLRPGDVIAAVDGHVFDGQPTRGDRTMAPALAAQDAIEAALADGRAEFAVLREGRARSVVMIPRPACHARFEVRAGSANQASSDGVNLQVSSDLMAATQRDGELAAILAHELAHNILRHRARLDAHEPGLKVRQTEVEADRLSVYLMDAAGYRVADAVAFWARWGRANDYGILSDGTHPGWKKRIQLIETEAAAIASARAAGRPVRAPADLAPR